MGEEVVHDIDKPEKPAADPQKTAVKAAVARFLSRAVTRKRLAILLGISVLVHAAGVAHYRFRLVRALTPDGPEVSLGQFRFEAGHTDGGGVARADFALHLSLLGGVDRPARRALVAHQYRVQEAVEQLLRSAHGADFEDPALDSLKRRLQERINETIGLRVISEVIVTDLHLTWNPDPQEPATETVRSVPWIEEPST